MSNEFAPAWKKPRMTKSQIRKRQKQYQQAAKKYKNTKKQEEEERLTELGELEDFLDY